MALLPFRCRTGAIAAFLAIAFAVIPADHSPAQARNLIEKILKAENSHKPRHRKRPAARRKTRKAASEAGAKAETKAPASSQAPSSVIPVPTPSPRPAETETAAPAKPEEAPIEAPRPADKPEEKQPEPVPEQAKEPEQPAKDERVYQVACPALISGEVTGELLPPIEDGAQCGEHSPLSLTAIGKEQPLKFSNAITTNCAMAVSLAQWSGEVRKAANEIYGGGVTIAEIGTGSDYQCRKVNGATTGRVSEHAFANALDIMSFKFSDGSTTELESGWNGSEKEKAFWRAVHGASCKLFMTVIGPDGDAAHRTNMHLDQGCHGKSCLARICQ